jgi:hypothetical protein
MDDSEEFLPSIEPPVATPGDPLMRITLPLSATREVLLQLYEGRYRAFAGIIESVQAQIAEQILAIGASQAAQARATETALPDAPVEDSHTSPATSMSKH